METIDIERVIKSPESIVHYLREAPCDPLKRDAVDLIENLTKQLAEAQKKAAWAENDLLKLKTIVSAQAPVSQQRFDVVAWAVEKWREEVSGRPLGNIHRRTLDDTWRQMIRHFGGDDIALCGLTHDQIAATQGPK